MPKIIFDIETVGDKFENYDSVTQDSLTRWIKKESKNEGEYKIALEDLKDGMGFSPLTGQVVSIGMLDHDSQKGGVYFQSPNKSIDEFEEDGIKYKPGTEKEILNQFWSVASSVDEFISFNGRSFDVPFILVRSAIHKIKPTKDLMSNRYLGSQKFGAKHVDLLDQLTFYGAVRRRGNLHMWCKAFGIKSPKEDGVTGDEVGEYFEKKRYKEIAIYNAQDLFSTSKLYHYWNEYLRL